MQKAPKDPIANFMDEKDIAESKTKWLETKDFFAQDLVTFDSSEDEDEHITKRGDGFVISTKLPRDKELYDRYKKCDRAQQTLFARNVRRRDSMVKGSL